MAKVKLSNAEYDVNVVTNKSKKLNSDEDVRGMCWYAESEIYISKECSKSIQTQTLYHELFHAMCDQSAFNDMLMEKLGDNAYEIFVDNMGKMLYDLIHNNDMKSIEKELFSKDKN